VQQAVRDGGNRVGIDATDGCKTARFEKYREGWELFRGESAEARGEGRPVGTSEERRSGDEAIAGGGVRFRTPIWRPRFFGR
jgi:hypothetical protein